MAALALFTLAAAWFNESAYVLQQGSKLAKMPDKVKHWDKVTERHVFKYFSKPEIDADLNLQGKSMVCVGARAGGEVRAFMRLGAFAIGVDIFPANDVYVLKGDAMNMQFAKAAVDFVYINVLDHIPDLEKFAMEAARVLKPGGRLLSHIPLQYQSEDKWAVRDTGTGSFFEEYDVACRSVGLITQKRLQQKIGTRKIWMDFKQTSRM